MKTPAWQRKAGKNPKGGLNEAGRRSAKAQGMNLKRPVKSGDNPRRASFLARMGNMPGPERKNGEPTRLLLSLRAWGASSKADARKKAAAISKTQQGEESMRKSTVNKAGNYTKPTMRKNLFDRIKAGGKGGAPGQWSARKAQMLAKQYKAKGGGYRD